MPLTETTLFPSVLTGTHTWAEYFGSFTSREYSTKIVTLLNKELLPSCQSAFGVFYQILTGNKLNPEKVTLAIGTDNGSFKSLYFPVVANKDNQLVIKWGDEIIPFNLVRDAATKRIVLQGYQEDTNIEVEYSIGDFPVYAGGNGKHYSNPGLLVSIYNVTAEKNLLIAFPLRTAKDTKIDDVKALDRQFQKDPSSLLAVLGSPEFGTFAPTFPLNNLPEHTDFTLKAIRVLTIKGEERYVLDLYTEEQVTLEDNKGNLTSMQGDFSVWSASSINNTVMALTSGLTGNTLELPEGSVLRMANIKTNKSGTKSAYASIIVPSQKVDQVDDVNFSW